MEYRHVKNNVITSYFKERNRKEERGGKGVEITIFLSFIVNPPTIDRQWRGVVGKRNMQTRWLVTRGRGAIAQAAIDCG